MLSHYTTAFAARLACAWLCLSVLTGLAMTYPVSSVAQIMGAPGEDNIVISRKMSPAMGPAMSAPRSTPMTPMPVTPAWLEAKVARLEAKAWGFDAGKLVADKNLLAAASSDGMRKVCIQDIGSSITTSNDTGRGSSLLPSSEPQIVVLKGDFVNICR